jgi:hypothetical protein
MAVRVTRAAASSASLLMAMILARDLPDTRLRAEWVLGWLLEGASQTQVAT